jgi:cytoskeleton protein RodZ
VSETEDKAIDTPRKSGAGPGERLQAARIKQGLSLEDVASRMHLSVSILEAIEENNFDEITAPIFVKGYLRAYARIVSLGEDEMIVQYVDFYSEEDPPISSTSNMTPELSATDSRIKWTTYFVIIALVVLLAAWWWNKQQNHEPPVSLDVPSSRTDSMSEAEPENENPAVVNEIQAGSESEISTQVSSASGATEMTSATDPLSNDSSSDDSSSDDSSSDDSTLSDANATSENGPDAGATDAVAEDPVAAAVTDESADTDAVVSTEMDSSSEDDSASESAPAQAQVQVQVQAGTREQPERIAPSGSDKVQLIIHADTWADVKDANNYQLVYDLLRADSVIELSGEAPFSVFLGNGHGIEIRFNGEEIGFANKVRDDNTARLKIGG